MKINLNGVKAKKSSYRDNAWDIFLNGICIANLFQGGFSGRGLLWYATSFFSDVGGVTRETGGEGRGNTPEGAILLAVSAAANNARKMAKEIEEMKDDMLYPK